LIAISTATIRKDDPMGRLPMPESTSTNRLRRQSMDTSRRTNATLPKGITENGQPTTPVRDRPDFSHQIDMVMNDAYLTNDQKMKQAQAIRNQILQSFVDLAGEGRSAGDSEKCRAEARSLVDELIALEADAPEPEPGREAVGFTRSEIEDALERGISDGKLFEDRYGQIWLAGWLPVHDGVTFEPKLNSIN
jgi:hypothetical protein